MTLFYVGYVALIVATFAAVLVARRRSDYFPVAAFLVVVTVANVARTALRLYVFTPALTAMRAAGLDPALVPFTGRSEVAAVAIDGALWFLWPAGIAAMCVAVYARRRPWIVGAVWAAASVAIAWAYPLTRGDVLRRCYLAAELAGLLTAAGVILTWIRKREPPTLPRSVALIIVGVDCGTLIGPYLGNPFNTWERAQALYLVLYIGIAIIQGGSLWRLSSTSS